MTRGAGRGQGPPRGTVSSACRRRRAPSISWLRRVPGRVETRRGPRGGPWPRPALCRHTSQFAALRGPPYSGAVSSAPPRIFYGWWVAVSFAVMVFLSSGLRFSVGPFLKPMVADLGLDRASFSLVISVELFLYGMLNPVRRPDRRSLRRPCADALRRPHPRRLDRGERARHAALAPLPDPGPRRGRRAGGDRPRRRLRRDLALVRQAAGDRAVRGRQRVDGRHERARPDRDVVHPHPRLARRVRRARARRRRHRRPAGALGGARLAGERGDGAGWRGRRRRGGVGRRASARRSAPPCRRSPSGRSAARCSAAASP